MGVISDTHGLLRPEAVAQLAGVQHILHAGDIGSPDVIEQLQSVAPVTAVRGNNDTDTWARRLPVAATFEHESQLVYVVHEIAHLRGMPPPPGVAAVVTGHSHRPAIEHREGVLFLNPGSAGPRRFKLPVSVATLTLSPAGVEAQVHELKLPPPTRRR